MSLESFIRFILSLIELTSETNLRSEENFDAHPSRAAIERIRHAKVTRLQILERIILVYLVGKQLLLVVIQYSRYFLTVELKKLNSPAEKSFNGSSSSGGGDKRASSSLRLLEQVVLANERALEFFGDPFRNMVFFVELVQIILSVSCLVYYISIALYSRFVAPINVSLIRAFANEKRELRLVGKLIEEERRRAIHLAYSIRFYRTIDVQAEADLLVDLGDSGFSELRDEESDMYTLDQYKSFVCLLNSVQQDNSLIPINRRPKWLAKLRKFYACCTACYLFFSFVCAFYALKFIWDSSRLGRTDTKPTVAAILCHLELNLMAYCWLSTLNALCFMVSCVFIDQSFATKKLQESVELCARTNSKRIEEILGERQQTQAFPRSPFLWPPIKKLNSNTTSSSRLDRPIAAAAVRIINNRRSKLEKERREECLEFKQINQNLLRILMNYRIFVRHILPSKHLYNYVVTLVAVFFIVTPIVLISQASYWKRSQCIIVISFFWLATVWHDSMIVPICCHNARVNLLLKSLFNLMAHVAQFEQANHNSQVFIYNPLIVTMIRREINQSELVIDKLAIKFFNSPIGYKHLLTMHFWAAILSAYAFYKRNSTGENLADDHSIRTTRSKLGLFG